MNVQCMNEGSMWHFRSTEDIEDVRREVEILHHLGGHPNITQLRGAYEDQINVSPSLTDSEYSTSSRFL